MTQFLKRMLFEIPFFLILYLSLWFKLQWRTLIVFAAYGIGSYVQGIHSGVKIGETK